jgi:hypothetical protein
VDPGLEYPLYKGFVHLGAGLACGLTGLAAGYAVGYVGDAVRLPLLWFAAVTDNPPNLNIVCPRIRLRIKSIRHYGPHPHLCRSARTLRVRYSCSSLVSTDKFDA